MNNLLFAVLIMALLYYFLYYLPRQKASSLLPKNKPLTSTISTQTNLSDKQISLLTQQWNQVASWAQEQGIDTNKSWNLTLLKNKIKQDLEMAKKKPPTASKSTSTPLNLKYSRTTQTDPDSDLENTLDSLISSMQDLNKQLDNPQLDKLQHEYELVTKKLKGEIAWESWETKEGIENYLQELSQKIKALENKK